MKELLEKRNDMLDKLDAILAKAKEEKRAFDEAELKEVASMKEEIRKIDESIKLEEEVRAFSKVEIKKPEQRSAEEIRAEEVSKEERAFLDYIEGRATGGLTTSGQSGVTIPLSVANKIVDKVVNMSNILSKVTTWNVSGDLSIPSYDFTAHVTGYVTEMTAISATNGAFTNITLKNNIIGTLSLLSRSMINRSDVDVLSYVVEAIAKNVAYFIEGELLAGAGGAGKLNGLAQISAGQIQTALTTGVIDSAELVKLKLKLPQIYQNTCEFIMNPSTLAYIQGLKASTGQFLMGTDLSQDGRYQLLGRPVNVSDKMPAMGAGNLEIFLGDFSGLHVKMTKAVSMDVLREKYADQYAYGITAFLECDSAIVEPQKIVAFKGL